MRQIHLLIQQSLIFSVGEAKCGVDSLPALLPLREVRENIWKVAIRLITDNLHQCRVAHISTLK